MTLCVNMQSQPFSLLGCSLSLPALLYCCAAASCFCDSLCQVWGDCCDDVEEACPNFPFYSLEYACIAFDLCEILSTCGLVNVCPPEEFDGISSTTGDRRLMTSTASLRAGFEQQGAGRRGFRGAGGALGETGAMQDRASAKGALQAAVHHRIAAYSKRQAAAGAHGPQS